MVQKIILYIIVSFFIVIPAFSQIITTIAGGVTGHGGYWGDGGPATAAETGYFFGIVSDANNNIYISDGNRIRRVDVLTGIIKTIAGTGVTGYNGDGIPATAAQLSYTGGCLSFDTSGNLYLYDGLNYRIRKIDMTTGIITTYAGNGSAGQTGDGGLATAASIEGNGDMTWDTEGNLYFVGIRKIRKISATGIITTLAGNGLPGVTGEGVPATTTFLAPMTGLAFDGVGNLYCADSTLSVRKISTGTGIITRVAGTGNNISTPYLGDGIPATSNHINPFDISVDNAGNLYISDRNNSRIEIVNTSGLIYTIAGTGVSGFSGDNGPATAAKISLPENVVLDRCGNLYIADFNNKRVRKVTMPPAPIPLTNTITASIADTICTGTAVTFTCTATAGSGTLIYHWYVNGSPLPAATSSSYSYAPANGDSVRCVVTASNTCGAADTLSSLSLYMGVKPFTTPTVTASAPAAIPIGSMVSLTATATPATATAGGYTMHWYNNGILFSTTTTLYTSYIKAAGTDHITAAIIPAAPCFDSATSSITSVSVKDAGISDLANTSITIWPNPAGGTLHVELAGAVGGTQYRIISIVGDALQHGALQNGDNEIDIRALPPGIYLITITTTDNLRTIIKFVKQ